MEYEGTANAARSAYANTAQAGGSILGGDAAKQSLARQPDLIRIADRIRRLCGTVEQAEELLGTFIERCGETSISEVKAPQADTAHRSGAIGEIDSALDRLEAVQERVLAAARPLTRIA